MWKIPKEVIEICKLKKYRKCNDQTKKEKWTKNDLQITTQKTKIEQHEPHSKPGRTQMSLASCTFMIKLHFSYVRYTFVYLTVRYIKEQSHDTCILQG